LHIQTVTQFSSKDRVQEIYSLSYDTPFYREFWNTQIYALYKEVFQSVALPRSLLLQSFIVYDLYPSSMRRAIDSHVLMGNLIERDCSENPIKANGNWFERVIGLSFAKKTS
jgi:hypothetical protein